MNINYQPPRNYKNHYYRIALGMGVGLTISSSLGLHRLPPIHGYQPSGMFRQYQTEYKGCESSLVLWEIKLDKAVERFLSNYADIAPLLLQMNQWVSSLDIRLNSLHPVDNNSGIVRVELDPINPMDPQHHFEIRNCNYKALKMKVTFGDGTHLERCLLVGVEHGQTLVLVEQFPLSKVIHTESGCYICREIVIVEATAYYPGPECTGESSDGITATGAIATFGISAVDPKVIPLGTKMYVMGYGLATALDVGGAIKGTRIDLCFNTYQEAVRFGRKRVKVFILD